MKPSVEYLGHRIDSDGLHPMDEKVRAIRDAPTPKNLAELRSFLGLINFKISAATVPRVGAIV